MIAVMLAVRMNVGMLLRMLRMMAMLGVVMRRSRRMLMQRMRMMLMMVVGSERTRPVAVQVQRLLRRRGRICRRVLQHIVLRMLRMMRMMCRMRRCRCGRRQMQTARCRMPGRRGGGRFQRSRRRCRTAGGAHRNLRTR